MAWLFVAILFSAAVGYVAGLLFNYLRFRKLRKSYIHKPQYNIQEDLSPAEFGCIVDGKVRKQELLGELVQLHMDGVVRIERNKAGRITVAKTLLHAKHTSEVSKVLLKALFAGGHRPVVLLDNLSALQATVEYATLASLHKKGWILPAKQYLGAASEVPVKYILRYLASSAAILAVVIIGSWLLDLTGEEMYGMIVLAAVLLCAAGVAIGLLVIAREQMLRNAVATMRMTNTYKQKWHHVNDVCIYLRVSGNDIFTPDYEDLEFQKLDSLYPYVVALGLDKRLLRSL